MKNQKNQPQSKGQKRDPIKQENAIVEMLQKRGLVDDGSFGDDDLKKAKKAKKRSIYHNTVQLLKHYRTICWVVGCFPNEVLEELDEPFGSLDTVLAYFDTAFGLSNRKLEYRLESIKRSRLLLDRINEALTLLKKKPGDGALLYDVIYRTYAVPDKLSSDELLEKLTLSSSQYYRLRKQAIQLLSIRLWTAPNKHLDAYLEALELFGTDNEA